MVFMAPLTEQGEGWGAEAMRDLGRFFWVVWRALKEWLGLGLGGWLSYQDFGESPFRKSAPHIDLTLNGWRANCQAPEKIPASFGGGGDKERLNEAFLAAAFAAGFRIGDKPGNSWVGEVREGRAALVGSVAYQVRELVDLRKVEYPPESRWVGWRSYKDGSVDRMPADRFMDWYRAYEGRARPHDAHAVHRAHGFMAGRNLRDLRLLGFSDEGPEHELGCGCSECEDWEKVPGASASYPGLEPGAVVF